VAELRRVGVFCGANFGASPRYRELAEHLGQRLAARGLGLVYGGGAVGLMGVVADAVLAGGGEVIGVIPESMMRPEVAHEGCSELIVVGDMFERKAQMMELADGFISLPGGIGTLDELLEVMTWNQLGYLAKPNGLLDVGGFWEAFENLLDAVVAAGFVRAEHRAALMRESDIDALLDRLVAWGPPASGALNKWNVES
jgi:hypothetical protein